MKWHGVPKPESRTCPECNGAGGYEMRFLGCDPEWYVCEGPGCRNGHIHLDMIHWHLVRHYRFYHIVRSAA